MAIDTEQTEQTDLHTTESDMCDSNTSKENLPRRTSGERGSDELDGNLCSGENSAILSIKSTGTSETNTTTLSSE